MSEAKFKVLEINKDTGKLNVKVWTSNAEVVFQPNGIC